jgi:hypothetical protein
VDRQELEKCFYVPHWYVDWSDYMKIIVIGLGGIGSYLAEELYRLYMAEQISDDVEFHFADFDTVEKKNILYQNYEADDVLQKKSSVIAERYSFYSVDKKIESNNDLSDYDLVVVCADNSQVRELVAKSGKPFIDLRAEGRAVAFFTKETENFPSKGEHRSCQLPFELAKKKIQNGNKIIASIGSQLVLNYLRKQNNPDEFIFHF